MKLYFSPGACSLSPHIVLCEAGLAHTIEKTNLRSKMTDSGVDFISVGALTHSARAVDIGLDFEM